jgi:hypothetical protein
MYPCIGLPPSEIAAGNVNYALGLDEPNNVDDAIDRWN